MNAQLEDGLLPPWPKELVEIQRKMEAACQNYMATLKDDLNSWYEDKIRSTVREQYQRSQELGLTGMADLKESFVRFTGQTTAEIKSKLSDSRYWSHRQDIFGLPNSLAKESAYEHANGIANLPFRVALAELYGRLESFLQKNGFHPTADLRKFGDNAKPSVVFVDAKTKTAEASDSLQAYAALHKELIKKKQSLEVAKVNEEKRNAAALWDSAFSQQVGDEVDWETAWYVAEDFWSCSEGSTGNDDWEREYYGWLTTAHPKEGEDSFRIFLTATENVEKYEIEIKRVWRAGLYKSVIKQTRKKDPNELLRGAIEEQIKNRNAEDKYTGYESILDRYRYEACRECWEYEEIRLCDTCMKCPECCRCAKENPFEIVNIN